MAKAHTISLISLWLFGKADPVVTKNQKLRLRYTLDYTFKPDKDSPSEEHRNVFDLEMSFTKAIELIKNSVTIAWQKVLREMSPEAARKTNGEVITMDMVFPGRRAATPLTKDEILKRLSAGASNDDIDDLIAQLEEMKS